MVGISRLGRRMGGIHKMGGDGGRRGIHITGPLMLGVLVGVGHMGVGIIRGQRGQGEVRSWIKIRRSSWLLWG